MGQSLVWFRNDLRVHDHEPLTRACSQAAESGSGVTCVYVVDPHWFGKTRFEFDRTGPFRAKFLRESLLDLDRSLKHRGSRLLVAHGESVSVIAQLAAQIDARTVYAQYEYASEEKAIAKRLRRRLTQHGIELRLSPPNTLLDPDDLPFSISELPEVFSKFRRKVESDLEVRPTLAPPTQVPSTSLPPLPDEVFGIEDRRFTQLKELFPAMPSSAARWGIDFSGGESAGLERIEDYFFTKDCLRVYKETRNGMLGADYSSKLSPWLALGCLSARRVYEFVRQYEAERIKNDSTYWLIFELLWRDYFAFVLAKHGSRLFQVGGLRELRLPWKLDQERFDAWRTGATGFPLIDANMRELATSGFMSNRGRQNVASFLTKNLGIDWRMGAEWFESMLIDYDPASNYGNWNYTAGIGNDARGFRWFNTLKQATTYDSTGDYVRHWLPELRGVPADFIHSPWKMHHAEQSRSQCVIGVDYPSPIVDLFKSAAHHESLYDQA